jgi:hypothetical protein
LSKNIKGQSYAVEHRTAQTDDNEICFPPRV